MRKARSGSVLKRLEGKAVDFWPRLGASSDAQLASDLSRVAPEGGESPHQASNDKPGISRPWQAWLQHIGLIASKMVRTNLVGRCACKPKPGLLE